MSQLNYSPYLRIRQAWVLILSTTLLLICSISLKAQPGVDKDHAIDAGTFGYCGEVPFSDSKTTYYYTNNYGSWGPDVWYKIEVTGPYADMRISTCTTSFDTYLHLVDANGTEISSNDDSPYGCSPGGSYIEYSALPTGTYYVVVDGTGTNYYGDMLLNISSVTNYSGNTPGDNMSNAINVGTFSGPGSYTDTKNIGTSCFTNDIGYPGVDVYYKFTLTSQSTVTFSHCGSGFDTYMLLLNSEGQIWGSDDDNAGPDCPGEEAYLKTSLFPGTYYLVSDGKYNNSGNLVTSITVSPSECPLIHAMPSNDQNYRLTYTPRLPLDNDLTLYNKTVCEINENIEYFDGLGRPLQTVQAKASPDQSNDIIVANQYDGYGRLSKTSLAYTNSVINGSYRADAFNAGTGVAGFYAAPPAGVTSAASPYSESGFEPSPLNRLLEQAAPGANYSLASGHTLKTNYQANVTAEVAFWSLTTSGATTSANYAAGELEKTVTKDENWTAGKIGTIEEFKDKQDRVVLKRLWKTESLSLSTYYIYDEYNNLRYVIPPGLTTTSITENTTPFNQFVYAYHFDYRNRLVEKKTPGKGWEYFIYNKLDQLVATQDANRQIDGKWLFTKYDALGRIVMTGVYASTSSPATIQAEADGVSVLWELRGSNATYSNDAFPKNNTTQLTVNYYDDYSFNTDPNYDFATHAYSLEKSPNARGLLTGTSVNIIGGSQYLKTVNYYDVKGRLITAIIQNHLGGRDRTDNFYNFNNELVNSTRIHTSATTANLTTANRYEYDNMGRKLRTYQTTGTGNNEVLLSELVYNPIGQLKTKKLHGGASAGASYDLQLGALQIVNANETRNAKATNSITLSDGFIARTGSIFTASIVSGGLQEINYSYTERGWLRGVSSEKFAMQLKYGDGTIPQYNGNVANQIWGTAANPAANNYAYEYDKLNRLISGTASTNNTEKNITYDDMGNITGLDRYLNNIKIDGLTFSYLNGSEPTNRLMSITDNTSNDAGLKHGTFTYDYDVNGNMKIDNSKGTAGLTVTYNLLNLPETNTLSGKTITYTYDATGRKLRRVSPFGSGTTTDYINGIQYTDGAIDFVLTDEGRAIKSGSNYNYEYNLTDNLGNVRLSFDTQSGTAVTKQQDDYLPFGMEVPVGTVVSPKNYYLYNKKELQEELGQYDYGARFYDPAIARWTSVDPLAEKMRRWSPYNYGFDNPIRFVDPDGMAPANQSAWYVNVAKWVGQKLTKNTVDTYNYTRDYISNEADNMRNRGARYEAAIRNGDNPNQVGMDYKIRQTVIALQLAENGINWLGTSLSGAEASLNGALMSTVAKPGLNTAGQATMDALKNNESKLASFTNKVYNLETATKDMTVYRVSGGTSTAKGGEFFSTIKPVSSQHAETMLNINNFGNAGTHVTPVTITKGSQYAIGGVDGGTGTQIFIPWRYQNAGGNQVIRLLGQTTNLQ